MLKLKNKPLIYIRITFTSLKADRHSLQFQDKRITLVYNEAQLKLIFCSITTRIHRDFEKIYALLFTSTNCIQCAG